MDFPTKPGLDEILIDYDGDELWQGSELYLPILGVYPGGDVIPQSDDILLQDYSPNGRDGTFSGSSFRFGRGITGVSWERTGINRDCIQFGNDDTGVIPEGANITIAHLYHKADGTDRNSYSFGVFGSTGTDYCHVLGPWSDGVHYWDYGGAVDGTTRLTVSGLDLSRSSMLIYTVGDRGMEIWQDGVLVASGTQKPTRTNSSKQFSLGAGGPASVNGDLTHNEMFAVWSRQLDEAEIWRVTNDPFTQVRRPQRRRLYFLVPNRKQNDGTAEFTIPLPVFAADAALHRIATVTLSIPLPTLAFTGTAYSNKSGILGISIPLPLLGLSGTKKTSAVGGFSIPLPTLGFTGTAQPRVPKTATATFEIPLPIFAATSRTSNVDGEAAFAMPLPVFSAGQADYLVEGGATGNLTDSGLSESGQTNLDWVIEKMQWEGLQLLEDIEENTTLPPLFQIPGYKYYKAVKAAPNGKVMIVDIRVPYLTGNESDQDPPKNYIDFWFTHHWGHTDWTKADDPITKGVYWEASTAYADSVTVDGVPFFDFGLYEIWPRVGTGQAMQDRARMRFLSVQSIAREEVTNPVIPGWPLPFYVNPIKEIPANITDLAATLQETIARDDGYPSFSSTTMSGRRQFEDNTAAYAVPSRSGNQSRFGMTHTILDILAEPTGNASGVGSREPAWYARLKQWANYVGNHIHPTGEPWDPNDARFDQLTAWIDGSFHQSSRGHSEQSWFFPEDTAFPDDWMAADPRTKANTPRPNRWLRSPRSHYGINHLCQYVQRYADPGIYRLIQNARSYIMGLENATDRGTSSWRPRSHRNRGRSLMHMVSTWHLNQADDVLLDHTLQHLDKILLENENTNFPDGEDRQAARPHGDKTIPYCYAPWEAGLHVAGLTFAATIPHDKNDPMVNSKTRIKRMGEVSARYCKYILSCIGLDGGVWVAWYETDRFGNEWQTPVAGRSHSLTKWCIHALQMAHYYLRPYFTVAENAKLDSFIADEWVGDINSVTSPNVWPDSYLLYHFQPFSPGSEPKRGRADFTIPLPQFTGAIPGEIGWRGKASPSDSGTKRGSCHIEIPLPVFKVPSGSGVVKTSGTIGFEMPIPIFRVPDGGGHLNRARSAEVGFSIPLPIFKVADGDGTVTTPSGPKSGVATFCMPLPILAGDVFRIVPTGTRTGNVGFTIPIPCFTFMVDRSKGVTGTLTFSIPLPIFRAGLPFGTSSGTLTFSIPLPIFFARVPSLQARELPTLVGSSVTVLPTLEGGPLTIQNQRIEIWRGDDIAQPFLVTLDAGRVLDGTESWRFTVRELRSDPTALIDITEADHIEVEAGSQQPTVNFSEAITPVSTFPPSDRDLVYVWDLEMIKGGKKSTTNEGKLILKSDVGRG